MMLSLPSKCRMTSAQGRTNRSNARANMVKTSAGRARSARNALRHGLNVPIADLECFRPKWNGSPKRSAAPTVTRS
jgi:hypothetical protein